MAIIYDTKQIDTPEPSAIFWSYVADMHMHMERFAEPITFCQWLNKVVKILQVTQTDKFILIYHTAVTLNHAPMHWGYNGSNERM